MHSTVNNDGREMHKKWKEDEQRIDETEHAPPFNYRHTRHYFRRFGFLVDSFGGRETGKCYGYYGANCIQPITRQTRLSQVEVLATFK